MKKIIFFIAIISFLFSQDKMILRSGEEIILKDRTNYTDYDSKDNFIYYNSKYYGKNRIALVILENGDIIFRSGMPFSKYKSLSIEKKARADKRTSSKKFKNINYALLGNLNEQETQAYLINFNDPSSLSGGQKATRVVGTIGFIWLVIGAIAVISVNGAVPLG